MVREVGGGRVGGEDEDCDGGGPLGGPQDDDSKSKWNECYFLPSKKFR